MAPRRWRILSPVGRAPLYDILPDGCVEADVDAEADAYVYVYLFVHVAAIEQRYDVRRKLCRLYMYMDM